jgi:uncharacterized integral membrane protein (TIGR00698 family)
MSFVEPAEKLHFLRRSHGTLRQIFPGFLVVLLIAFSSSFVSEHYGGPVMLYALLLGMACNFLSETPKTTAGIFWSAKHILHIGVALLGVRMGVHTFTSLGIAPVLIVVMGVILTMAFGLFLAAKMGLGREFGILSGGATAICGASAALAISSILPKNEQNETHTLLTIVVITALSTFCMIIYPLLVPLLGFDDQTAGIFLGATIHDVAQVVGAGYIISDVAGDTATIVKLMRVAMLVPVCLALTMTLSRHGQHAHNNTRLQLPWFLLAFVALAALSSMELIPALATALLTDLSRWCLVIAIAAIGVKTSLGKLQHVGWKPIVLIISETLFLLMVVLAAILAF